MEGKALFEPLKLSGQGQRPGDCGGMGDGLEQDMSASQMDKLMNGMTNTRRTFGRNGVGTGSGVASSSSDKNYNKREKQVRNFRKEAPTVMSMAVNFDGTQLVAGTNKSSIFLYNIKKRKRKISGNSKKNSDTLF